MRKYLCMVGMAAALCACTPQGDPPVPPSGFSDDFESPQLKAHWKNTGGPWEIRNGELQVQGAKNHPLWLRRTLPRDLRIEFDARSDSPEGDIKVEVFGDGDSRATAASYTATSYVVIFGGWGNKLNVLARMNEHGDDRVVGPARAVEAGRRYHFRIERKGRKISTWVDDQLLVEMDDPAPLAGAGHDHFAFNNWASALRFDNLEISPL